MPKNIQYDENDFKSFTDFVCIRELRNKFGH